MDAIIDGLMSNNGWLIAILLVVLTIFIVKCAKAGLFKFKNDTLQIGLDFANVEQTVIRHQIEFAKSQVEAYEKDIPRFDGYDEFRGKYILEKLFDEIISWIIFNHIESTKSYMNIKKKIILNIIKKNTVNTAYTEGEFVDVINKSVEDMIRSLISIREEYYKKTKKKKDE